MTSQKIRQYLTFNMYNSYAEVNIYNVMNTRHRHYDIVLN